ncbi:MAG: NUDIX domain-containing protein [Flavobacterium sp.]
MVRFHCKACDFTYYHTIAAAVAVIFRTENKILFTVRNVDPDKGKLDLPGGFIDSGENAEVAACREIKEELGITIQPNQLRYITTSPNNYLYKNIPYRTMDIFYEVKLGASIAIDFAEDEIEEVVWMETDKIDLEKIGFVSVRNVIEEYYFD